MIRSRFLVRLLAIVVLGTTTLSSCSTLDAPTAPASAAETAQVRAPVLGSLLKGLLVCDQQRYARTVTTVGSAGGTIRVGKHTLVIPRGALTRSVTITAEAPADFVASVRFSPEGLKFSRPATVTLDYSSCPSGTPAASQAGGLHDRASRDPELPAFARQPAADEGQRGSRAFLQVRRGLVGPCRSSAGRYPASAGGLEGHPRPPNTWRRPEPTNDPAVWTRPSTLTRSRSGSPNRRERRRS